MGSERDSQIKEADFRRDVRRAIDSIRGELDDLRDALVFEELVKHRGSRKSPRPEASPGDRRATRGED